MNNKFTKYENLIIKLNIIINEQNKLNFKYNSLKEKIDEYETNNLEYIDEINKIRNKFNLKII
jgi:hypothetical protein